MQIDTIQNKIDETDYWDMQVLDLKSLYFGDEIDVFIDNDKDTCWKYLFLSCYRVTYETDSNRRKWFDVKDMKKNQLGYYAQDISICEGDENDYYTIKLDFSIMIIQIECKDVLIEKIQKNELDFFWNNNGF